MTFKTEITWHDANEDVPDDDQTVLIIDENWEMHSGYLDGEKWRYENSSRAEVILWAEIPDISDIKEAVEAIEASVEI